MVSFLQFTRVFGHESFLLYVEPRGPESITQIAIDPGPVPGDMLWEPPFQPSLVVLVCRSYRPEKLRLEIAQPSELPLDHQLFSQGPP